MRGDDVVGASDTRSARFARTTHLARYLSAIGIPVVLCLFASSIRKMAAIRY